MLRSDDVSLGPWRHITPASSFLPQPLSNSLIEILPTAQANKTSWSISTSFDLGDLIFERPPRKRAKYQVFQYWCLALVT